MLYTLNDIPLFSELKIEYLELLHSQMHIHHYYKDSIVFYEGDKSEYLHVLLEGTVRLYKTTPKGTEIHLHHFLAPEIIALFLAFEDIPFPASCEFVSEGVIGLIPLRAIHECLAQVDFSIALIKTLSKRMKLMSNLLHRETVYSADAKIADLILYNPSLFETLKKNEIASILNMTPETLSRILSKLKKEKMISIEQHIVTILKPKELIKVIERNRIQKIVE
jgi:CRP/FNR family transcriptional regulator